MKRTLMIILVVILIAAMTACSGKSSTTGTGNSSSGGNNSSSGYIQPKTADTPTPAATIDSNQKSWSPIFIVTSPNPKSVKVLEQGGELDC
jgi:hypothetical protein